MTDMTGKTTSNLYSSIHKTTPGHDAGAIVEGVAVAGVLYPDFEARRISKTRVSTRRPGHVRRRRWREEGSQRRRHVAVR